MFIYLPQINVLATCWYSCRLQTPSLLINRFMHAKEEYCKILEQLLSQGSSAARFRNLKEVCTRV
jgi:hypothetical protein